ncbi:MAG: hypothetical protein Q9166_004379 [cf. Caloplaca sp. 2 TL-2023]
MCTPSTLWSHLEALPPEVLRSISVHLAFFDKKALGSTSRRVYDLVGPVKPPDRFAWRLHVCTSFNRCPDDYFDITIFHPDDVTRELSRILKQTPETPKRGHYDFDPLQTRLKDLTCLYFPPEYHIRYGTTKLRCQTLGQFVAIQFRFYVARLMFEAQHGEAIALERMHIDLLNAFTVEHKANLRQKARKWREMKGLWLQAFSAPKCDKEISSRVDRLPMSTVQVSENLVRRMGIQELHGPIRLHGQLCELREDQGTIIGSPKQLGLPTLIAQYHSDANGDCGTLAKSSHAAKHYVHRAADQGYADASDDVHSNPSCGVIRDEEVDFNDT